MRTMDTSLVRNCNIDGSLASRNRFIEEIVNQCRLLCSKAKVLSDTFQAGLKYEINDNLNLHIEGKYDRNYNLMPTYTVTGGIHYQPNEKFILESTLEYTHRNFNHYGIANNLFLHGHLGYKITDRVSLHGFSGIPLYHSAFVYLFNTKYFGGSIELKLSKRIGIQGGVQWQYDPFTHRMKLMPFGGLLFYKIKKEEIQNVKYYIMGR